MAREKGILGISANFEPQKAGPLDARFIVDEKADLTLVATWTANDGGVYAYKGMVVSVHSDTTPSNNGIYRLTDIDYTDINNWEQLGTGGGGISYTETTDLWLREDGSYILRENDVDRFETDYKTTGVTIGREASDPGNILREDGSAFLVELWN